jgi:hypothetical protein
MPLGFLILLFWTIFLGRTAVSVLGVQGVMEGEYALATVLALGLGIELFRRMIAFPLLSRVVGIHLFIPFIDGTWDWLLSKYLLPILGLDRPEVRTTDAELEADFAFAEAYEKDPEFAAAALEKRGVPSGIIELWLRNPDLGAPGIDAWLRSNPPADRREWWLDELWHTMRPGRDQERSKHPHQGH